MFHLLPRHVAYKLSHHDDYEEKDGNEMSDDDEYSPNDDGIAMMLLLMMPMPKLVSLMTPSSPKRLHRNIRSAKKGSHGPTTGSYILFQPLHEPSSLDLGASKAKPHLKPPNPKPETLNP